MPPVGMSRPYGQRAATSARGRALPIAVASGLALGVFAGLFVVRGTGDDADEPAATAPSPDAGTAQPAVAADEPVLAPDAGAAQPEAAEPTVATISFTVKPRRAHIYVDGTELEGTSTQVPLRGGEASFDVVIRSHGHRSHRQSYTVTGDQTIDVELRKRDEPAGPGSLLDIR
jgi:hypothetical protein